MNSISKSALLTILTQIPSQLFGIIAGIFITRILGPEGKGAYALFFADVNLFIAVLGFSITTAIIQFTASKRVQQDKLLAISILFSLTTIFMSIGILLVLLSLPIAEHFFPSGGISWEFITWFILFLTATQINTVYSAFFQGARRFDIVNRVLLINSVMNITIFGVAFALYQAEIVSINLLHILLISLVVITLNTLQWHLHFRRVFTYTFDLKLSWKKDIAGLFKFMGMGHLSNIINFLNYQLVIWILAYYLDEGEVGLFALAAGLSQLFYFISQPLSQVLMPFLSSELEEGRKKMFVRFARIHFTIIAFIAVGVLAIVPIFIPVLYGQEFAGSVIIFEFLIGGIILSCQTKVFASYFVANNRMDINLYATIVGFLLTFFFNFFLIAQWGVKGAAIAQTITFTGIFLFVFLALVTFGKVGTKNLFIINRKDINYARSKFKRKSR